MKRISRRKSHLTILHYAGSDMKTDSISLKEEVAITEYDAQLQIKSTC